MSTGRAMATAFTFVSTCVCASYGAMMGYNDALTNTKGENTVTRVMVPAYALVAREILVFLR